MTERATVLSTGLLLSIVAIAPRAHADTPKKAATAPSSTAPVSPAPQPTQALSFGTSSTGTTDEAVRTRARNLYDQGAQAYNESRYSQAAEYFLDAHRVYPTPQLLFNVAKAYDKLGVSSSALAYYRDYLRQMTNAPDAAEVGTRVRELESILAQRGAQQLSVITDPAHALLAVDGVPVGVTPYTGETWPGDHQIAITLDGHKPVTSIITVNAVRAQDFLFTLERAPSNADRERLSQSALNKPSHVSALTWLVLGTGTAALATTLVVEMAQKNSTGLTRTGAFFGGVGVTASILGGVLLHLDLYEPDATPTQKKRAWSASVSGTF